MTKILISLLLGTLCLTAQSQYTLTLSKHKVYISEPLTATLSLEHNQSLKISKIQTKPLLLEGYKVIPLPESQPTQTLQHYILIPQRTGTHTLPAQSIAFAHKDLKTYRNIWKTLQTSPVPLTVLPLPEGIYSVGNYTLHSHIDHNSTKANQPINLTITLQGKGSLETMPALTLPSTEALLFASEPTVETRIIQGSYQSTYTQHFAIIAEHDFTLPSLEWRYLNTDTGLIETLSTPSYTIQVDNPIQKTLLFTYLSLLLGGMFLGGILTIILLRRYSRGKPSSSEMAKAVYKAKTDKALYTLLLPYADDDRISEVLGKLEENMYQSAGHPIDRKKVASYYNEKRS